MLFVFLLLGLIVAIWRVVRLTGDENERIGYSLFQTDSGWGYDIQIEGKTFIHQESVPALVGNSGFLDKASAERVARIVMEKMKRQEAPAVSPEEVARILDDQPKKSN